MRSLRELTGRDESEIMRSLRARGRVTGLLLLSAFVGGLGVGGLGAAAGLAFLPNAGRQLRALAAVFAGIFVPGFAFWLPSGTLGMACLVSALLGAAPAFHLFVREMDERLDWRGRFVLSSRSPKRRIAALGLWSNTLLPTWAPLALVEATLLAFVLEWSWHLPGLGPKTVEAVRAGDAAWLMAVCLSLGLLTALTQIVANSLLGTGRPRGGEA
jgi:ABC-type dipeptide/oligopeptide/nickel transport system permease component